ncbi:hypothetical protein [Kiloniella litopenaei]|uniref:hypothetical protein n=1 Tax=Kiloniella litopenaei TaxID=1549748 RepID=UPI003BAD47A6
MLNSIADIDIGQNAAVFSYYLAFEASNQNAEPPTLTLNALDSNGLDLTDHIKKLLGFETKILEKNQKFKL